MVRFHLGLSRWPTRALSLCLSSSWRSWSYRYDVIACFRPGRVALCLHTEPAPRCLHSKQLLAVVHKFHRAFPPTRAGGGRPVFPISRAVAPAVFHSGPARSPLSRWRAALAHIRETPKPTKKRKYSDGGILCASPTCSSVFPSFLRFVFLLSSGLPMPSYRNSFLVRLHLDKHSLSPQRAGPLLLPQPADTVSVVCRYYFIARSSTASTERRLKLL